MPDSRLQQAIDHHLAGRLPEAESLYRAILAEHPDQPDANHNLGDIAFRAGKLEQAVALLQKALMADPQNQRNWNSLINVLIEAGYPDDALKVRQEGEGLGILEPQAAAASRTKSSNTSSADADRLPELARRQVQEAENLFAQGQIDRALRSAAQIAAKYPTSVLAAHAYGKFLLLAGKPAEAVPVLERAHTAKPDHVEILAHLGASLHAVGRLRDAATTYDRALEIDPDHAAMHCNLAMVLNRLHEHQRARQHAARALELQPDYPEALNNLGTAWLGLNNSERARQAYAMALKLKPDYFAAHVNLGNLYRDKEQLQQAEAMYRSALELKPDHAEIWHNLGTICKETGRPEEAAKAYRKALDIAPERLEHADALSEFLRFEDPADPLLQRLKQALASDQISERDKQFAGFVLGKAMLDLGRPDEAWNYYRLANEAAYPHIEPSPSYASLLAAYRKLFNPAFQARVHGFGRQDSPMVLVVGFSRSGKSLIESLLAAHPALYAQGERRHLIEFAQRKFSQSDQQLGLDYLAQLTVEQSRADAAEYLESIKAGEGPRPVNTLPGNLYHLGLLACLLPQVPIVFCRRQLMDLGLACYFKRYASANRYTYKLEDLGRQIRIYEAFMDFWLEVLPNPMLEVQYEDLVADPEACAQRLYAFVGLDYRAEYLDVLKEHSAIAENVSLAHSLEAPAPIRKDFVNAYLPFADQLAPLREAYEQAAQALQTPSAQ